MVVNSAFLTGGLISYDGVHPTSLGYAVWADEVIQFINESYGASIPRVDMYSYLFNGNSSSGGYPTAAAGPLSPEEVVEWAAAIFTEENTRQLLSLFPVPAASTRSTVAPAPEEQPIPAETRGERVRIAE